MAGVFTGLRRDDSSIDSLECSPPPRKDKISLSRDSGLTMSDSQLYTPDEEESASTGSSGYDPAFDNHTKVDSEHSSTRKIKYINFTLLLTITSHRSKYQNVETI